MADKLKLQENSKRENVMKTRTIFVVSLVVWTMGMIPSPQIYADERGYGAGGDLTAGFFYKAHFFLEEGDTLGLTEEQENAMRQLKIDTKKQVIHQSAEIDVLEVDIMAKLHESKIDVAAVQKLIDQKYEIKKALAKTVVEAFAKLKSTVSEKQWQDMKKLKKERMELRREACAT